MDWEFLTGTLIRWLHLVSGIIWVGTLYSLVLIQGPATRQMDADLRRNVLPALMPRALWWLRWAAMSTLLFGIALFVWEYHRIGAGFGNNANLKAHGSITDRGWFIMTGMLLALILWFIAWFLVWPAWRRVLKALVRGEEEPGELIAQVGRRSRLAFLLTGPLILFMVCPQNYFSEYTMLSVLILGGVGAGVMGLLLCLAHRLPFGSQSV